MGLNRKLRAGIPARMRGVAGKYADYNAIIDYLMGMTMMSRRELLALFPPEREQSVLIESMLKLLLEGNPKQTVALVLRLCDARKKEITQHRSESPAIAAEYARLVKETTPKSE
jgi:hypothetical protein